MSGPIPGFFSHTPDAEAEDAFWVHTGSDPSAHPALNKLLRASVVQNDADILRIRRQQASIGSDVAGELSIFTVDFALYAPRSSTNAFPPSCVMEARFRRRCLLGSPLDQAERARILTVIPSAGQSLRRAHWPLPLLRFNHIENTRALHTYIFMVLR